MAGHSKWANIKHRKAAQDKKRGKVFTKVLKEITVAAKAGGGDPEMNPRLRLALVKARSAAVPKDTVDKAIKKATGEGADDFHELTYEGYGPDGVAVFIETATDNPTRTVSAIRSYFNRHNGSLGKDGCLQFIFDQKAVYTIKGEGIDEDELTLELIDAGAEEVEREGDNIIISGPMESFGSIGSKLEELKVDMEEGELQRIPTTYKALANKDAFDKVMKLIDIIEDDDDVQKVYHNIEFNEEFMGE